jgi:hypothetical protein
MINIETIDSLTEDKKLEILKKEYVNKKTLENDNDIIELNSMQMSYFKLNSLIENEEDEHMLRKMKQKMEHLNNVYDSKLKRYKRKNKNKENKDEYKLDNSKPKTANDTSKNDRIRS